jgi:DNA-binding NarL/FixJ family response regulator
MALRILIGDDNACIRGTIRRLLEQEALEVIAEAADGREAVELASVEQPDVAVLDFEMPRLNGVQAAGEIHAVCPDAAFVLLSGSWAEHQVITAIRAGIRGYVVKADLSHDLVRAIHDVRRGALFLSPRASRAVVDVFLPDAPSSPGRRRRA